MRVMVLGAGALGGYFGARLEAAGHEVTYVARGAHLAAMQRDGLTVESPAGDIRLPKVRAVATPEEAGPADLVLFMVKNYDVDRAAAALASVLPPEARVLTVQNGVTAPEVLAARIGADRVFPGAVYMPADIKAPGVIRHSAAFHRVVFGGLTGGDAPRLDEAAQAISATGIDVEVAEDIRAVLWEKFVMMSANSAITALTRLDIGPIRETPATMDLLKRLIAETEAVAEAEHPGLPAGTGARALDFLVNKAPAGMHASMLDDLERGKPLELDWLSGEVVRRGEARRVETLAHAFVYAALAPYAAGRAAS